MKRLRKLIASLMVVAGLMVMAVPASGVSMTCHHGAQGLHELTYVPASWPGTRAAHSVSVYSGLSIQTVYTKSGWWDPSWDFYYQNSYVTCVG